MSAPVAGRRKGQNTLAATTATFPSLTAASPTVPSWLDDESSQTPPSQASPVAFYQQPSSPSFAPTATSIQFTSPTAASANSTSPVFDDGAGLPAFLRDDTSQPQPMQQSPVPLSMSHASPYSNVPSTFEDEHQRRATLTRELASLTQELSDATRRVEVLQGDGHPAAAEIKELEATLIELRAQEAEKQRQAQEREAQVRVAAAASAAENSQSAIDAAVSAFREECRQRCQQELDTVVDELHAQQSTNLSLQKDCEEVMSTTPEVRCQAVAFEALHRRLQDGARHLRQQLSQQCSTTVALSARTFLAAAREQRDEVFANDTARRSQQLQRYQEQRAAAMETFHEECRGVFQGRADTLFGSLKASVEKRRRQAQFERSQRLGTFHARLHAMTERGRVTLEQQVRVRAEREVGIIAAQRESTNTELALRHNELAQQRRAFLSHAEAEYQSLQEAHGALGVQTGIRTSPSPSVHVTTAPLDSLRREAESARARLDQVALTLRTKTQSLVARSPSSHLQSRGSSTISAVQPTPFSKAATGRSMLSAESAAARWRESLVSLTQRRAFLQTTIAELKSTTHTCSEAVQRSRGRLAEQRDEVQQVRAEWEGRIRTQLATCLTVRNPQVPALALLTTATLDNLKGRLLDLMQTQSALRSSRSSFAAQVAAWVESIHDYRGRTELLLSSAFTHFELLREKSVQAEVDDLALQSIQAQAEVLHRHVSEEAKRLATQKQKLDALVRDISAGKAVAALPSSPVPSADQNTQGQSTKIFSGCTSPLLDLTNGLRHRENGEPAPENTATPQKAVAAAAPSTQRIAVVHRKQPSSAVTTAARTRITGARDDGGDGGGGDRVNDIPRGHRASGRAATTAVSASSGVDLFGSDSPSPIMPALEAHSALVAPSTLASSSSRGAAGTGAWPSVSPQTDDPPEWSHRPSTYGDGEFVTALEPLDDDDASEMEPLPYYE